MSYIDDLIKECCPDRVEWKELGEVCDVNKGKQLNKELLTNDGKYPAYNGGKTYSGRTNDYNVEANTIIVSQGGASAGFVNFVTSKFWANAHCYYLLPDLEKVDNRFLYHFVKMKQSYLMAFQHGAGIPALKLEKLANLQIPLPPLKIQQEIVQILDKFTEYVTELTAELTDRQKQYTYYRDKLLSFEDEVYQVEWKMLGEVAVLKNGRDWKSLSRGSIPVYGSGGEMGEFVAEYAYNKPTVLIPRKGSISNLFYLEKPFWNVDTIYYTEIDHSNILPKYFYYYLKTVDLESMATNPTRPSLTQSILEKIEFPVPSLQIQERIVQVLDNFDAVCNDLNIGLPKEIELRQKQYEYFRDKLLTFAAEGVYTNSTVQYRQDLIRLLQWVFGAISVELGAICDFTRGNGLQKKDFTEDGFPVIHYGQIYTRYGFSTKTTISYTNQSIFDKLKKAQPNDIIMATTSENVEDVGKSVVWEGDKEIGISGDAYILHTSQNARFINYYLKSIHFQTQKEKKVTGTKVIRINSNDMQNFTIIIPSIETQSRIVSILDRFDNLVNSISNGLPKEIALRQKQYEYFRDKLLSFDRNKIF
ncbi:TPA: restriction endonuclease subunit S [Streptococcus suis]|nr:restriction endonuclease subunit S [Streptococcus suis]